MRKDEVLEDIAYWARKLAAVELDGSALVELDAIADTLERMYEAAP